MRRAVACILLVLAAPALAVALDQPVTGAKLQLKQSSAGKQKLVFQSKDQSFPFPIIQGPDDPSAVGATIEIVTPGLAPVPFFAPDNAVSPGWTSKPSAVPLHRFKRAKDAVATTPIKAITIKSGRGFSVIGEATGIPLDGTRGTVAVRITIGSLRACARFTGVAVTKDAVGAFLGKNATTDGFADCSLTSLTGEPPRCGDGEVNQSSEECDADSCASFGMLMCRPPGASNECTCCTDSAPSGVPCCNPSAVAVHYPPDDQRCFAMRCDPPDSCRDGDECQADHSCCSTLGGNTCVMSYFPYSSQMIPLAPCCPGLECRRSSMPFGAVCCAAGGTTCAADGDCCTGHCQIGGTCEACRAGAISCSSNAECCSGSCTGGVCDACAPTGTFCTSGATCCSSTCVGFQCQ